MAFIEPPGYRYTYPSGAQHPGEWVRWAQAIEDAIPGVRVMLRMSCRPWLRRVLKSEPEDWKWGRRVEVGVPVAVNPIAAPLMNGAERRTVQLHNGADPASMFTYPSDPPRDPETHAPTDPVSRWCEEAGRRIRDHGMREGALREATEELFDYQLRLAGWYWSRASAIGVASCGSGKSVAFLIFLASLTTDQVTLIVCPGGARYTWQEQIERWTTWEPYLLLPTGQRPEASWSPAQVTDVTARVGKLITTGKRAGQRGGVVHLVVEHGQGTADEGQGVADEDFTTACGKSLPDDVELLTDAPSECKRCKAAVAKATEVAEWESCAQYLTRKRRHRERAIVVVGLESLPDYLDEVFSIQPHILGLDEVHRSANHKRVRALPTQEGDIEYEQRVTKATERGTVNRVTRAVAIAEVSRISSLQRRIPMTATVYDDGKPRNLWAPGDLMDPGAFDYSYWNYARRFCGAVENDFGGMDDTGVSSASELRRRWSYYMMEISYAESHREMPPMRFDVVRVPLDAQSKVTKEDRQLLRDEDLGDLPTKERVVISRLAEASLRNRRQIVADVTEAIKHPAKVVVFTYLKKVCEHYAHILRKALPPEVPVDWGHGETSHKQRHRMVQEFATMPGPRVLVLTGHAFGVSINGLEMADHAMLAALPWNPTDYIQWRGRFDRHGGVPTWLRVYRALGTYADRVSSRLAGKMDVVRDFMTVRELDDVPDELRGWDEQSWDALVEELSVL